MAFELSDTTTLDGKQRAGFLHLLEVYVDDFIQMAQTSNRDALRCVFLPREVTGHSGQDPMLLKKLMKREELWDVQRETLG